ncbi:MAG: class I SAM-dependent methyltransferase [Kribbellaceae bacterium]
MDPLDRTRRSYDAVAERYAEEIGGELAGKPLERAMYAAFADLVGPGARVGDVGCGPGHVTAHLASLGLSPVGLDPSAGMVSVARGRYPGLPFRLGAAAELGEPDRAWAGAVAAYSLIHVEPADRPAAYAELARVIAPGGWLLVLFHISMADQPVGSTKHFDEWWGHQVDLDFHFLDPAEVASGLAAAGFTMMATLEREPWPGAEAASRRASVLARRTT